MASDLGEGTGRGAQTACALWYVGPRRAELRETTLGLLIEGHARIRTRFSALSRGTERLVFEGRVPALENGRMRAPLQAGDFPFPVKYGYCAVGTVEEGPLAGRDVFVLHPHQDRFDAPANMLVPVPEGVPARRALLAANMETALNAIWDSGASAGDRIAVIGAGLVGLLVGYLAARLPGAEVTIVDINEGRREAAHRLGCRFRRPIDAPEDCDLVIHASASPAGLACALSCAGAEAKVVEMSWYGDREVPVPLGLDFHDRRLTLVSSQVGRIPASRVVRWSLRRRLDKAMALLADERLDILLSEEVAFADLPGALPRLLAAGAPGACTIVSYP